MKFGTTLAAAATLAILTTEVDARGALGQHTKVPKYNRHNRSSYAKKRVAEERDKMELVYGKGLVGLYGTNGKIDQKKFGWDTKRASAIWIQIGETQLNAGSFEAFTFGYVEGVQYDAMTTAIDMEVMSNCFYAAKGALGSVDTIVYDFMNLGAQSGQYNWFNIILFDPLHILGDLTVLYEMCNIYEDIDKLVGTASLDWGLVSEQLTQIGMYMGLESKKILEEIADNMGEDCMEEAIMLANEAINAGLNEVIQAADTNFEDFSVDGLTETLADSGYILDCAIQDINLYVIGKDLGTMMARMLQSQIDSSN